MGDDLFPYQPDDHRATHAEITRALEELRRADDLHDKRLDRIEAATASMAMSIAELRTEVRMRLEEMPTTSQLKSELQASNRKVLEAISGYGLPLPRAVFMYLGVFALVVVLMTMALTHGVR